MEKVRKSTGKYALRLPRSLKAKVEQLADQDGTSVNQFITMAVAEKIAAMETAQFFAERKTRADFDTFNRIMNRSGGEPPRLDDQL